MMKFFNKNAASIAATAYATAVSYATVATVKEEKSSQEHKKQQHFANGAKPQHTPPREPITGETVFKIGF
ncbi:MAG: hypothetical protein WC627_13255 [Legionella sp.]|jgi:hypothetical protein